MFQPIYRTITIIFGLVFPVSEWESKGLSHRKSKPPYTASKSLSSKFTWNESRIRLKFEKSCLKQENKAFTPNNVVNLFIVHDLDAWSQKLNTDFTLKDRLFGAIKLTKNADLDKYKYSGYGIGFDSRSEFSLKDGNMGKSVIIFGADMSASVDSDNKEKDL